MSYDTNNSEKEIGMDLNFGIVWEVGIVFVVVTVVMTIFLYGLYLRVSNAENARKLYTPRIADTANAKLSQLNEISRYSWVDQELGLVSIPIELAMNKTANNLSTRRSEAGRLPVVMVAPDETGLAGGGSGESQNPHGE